MYLFIKHLTSDVRIFFRREVLSNFSLICDNANSNSSLKTVDEETIQFLVEVSENQVLQEVLFLMLYAVEHMYEINISGYQYKNSS